MKKYLYILIGLLGMVSCNADDIDLYKSSNYISFVNKESDTVVISFLLLGNLKEYDCPIPVRLSGMPLSNESEFSLRMNEDKTTASPKFYDFPITCFAPNQALDTFYIKLKNFSELTYSSVVLCLELQKNVAFELGDRNYRRIYISMNDNIARPDWWTSSVEKYYLGDYSDKKFRRLITAAKPDLSVVNDDLIRGWALQLKYALMRDPDTEIDGSQMTVPVK
ncbi:MAG: DUF4843 domain-containing protein [Odoribacter sp.]